MTPTRKLRLIERRRHQYCSVGERFPEATDGFVHYRVVERVAWGEQVGAGQFVRMHVFEVEGHAVVFGGNGPELGVAQLCWDIADFVPAAFAFGDPSAETGRTPL